jgi:hypothetical protein
MRGYNLKSFLTSGLARKSAICFVFSLFLAFFSWEGLYALPSQKQLQPGDWAYDALAILSREQGRVFFADSRITVAQAEKFMEEIDANSLSESGLAIYDQLEAYLNSSYDLGFRTDAISGGVNLILQPELYYKTSKHIPWVYNAHARNPILQLPLGFSLSQWITAEMDIYVGENEYAATLHDNYGNIPLDPVAQADIHFPKRGYMSFGVPVGKASGVNIAFGLGDNFFGNTHTGSIVISEYLERTVYAQLAIYSPALKYTAQVLQYEVNKYQYMHYLQVRPHRVVSLSLAEGVMVNAPLELRFLNPFTIFHSYEAFKTYTNYNEDLGHQNDGVELGKLWDKNPDGTDKYDRIYDPNGHSRIGSYFGVKLEFQPVRHLRFYALFVMNQFNLPMKKTHWEDTLYPDAAGFQAGTEYTLPVRGGHWEFGLEGVYTYPYLYVLWDKGHSFYKEVPEMSDSTYKLRYWTGTPFGPDTIAGALWAGFRSTEQWYAGLSFVVSAQGKRSSLDIFDLDDDVEHTYRPSHAVFNVTVPPTGTPILTYTVTLRGEYSPRKWLDLILQPGYRVLLNAGHDKGRIEHGFECALSVRYRPLVK